MNCDTNQNDQGSADGEFNEYNKREEDQRKLELYNMTTFQMLWCQQKANEETFGSWVHTRGSKKRGQGTLLMAWYNKDGTFHSVHLGMKEVIATAGAVEGKTEKAAFDVTFTPRQPGKSYNEKHVRFEVFVALFATNSSYSYDPGTGLTLVTVSDAKAAAAYLTEHGFKFAGYAADQK